MKKIILCILAIASVLMPISAQQPQTQLAPISPLNAKYVQGVGIGYWSTAGSGLNLALTAGTVNCAATITTYSGGTLVLTASVLNYIYLNTAASCVPATKTTAFTTNDIPLAIVLAGSSTISNGNITEARTMFSYGAATVLTVGVTPVNSGTPGDILYDNSGVIGNLGTTGSGIVVLAADPALTGVPTAPTATAGNNSGQISTTQYVDSELGVIPITSFTAGSSSVLGSGGSYSAPACNAGWVCTVRSGDIVFTTGGGSLTFGNVVTLNFSTRTSQTICAWQDFNGVLPSTGLEGVAPGSSAISFGTAGLNTGTSYSLFYECD